MITVRANARSALEHSKRTVDCFNLKRLRSLTLDTTDIQRMPAWLRSLPLEELQVTTKDETNGYEWDRDEDALPRTLKIFRLGDFSEQATLQCLRQLTQLEEVHLGTTSS